MFELQLREQWRGETVETPCVACRCVVLPNLQRCVLLTTYGGPPATPPGSLPLLRVTSPDCLTRSYPHCHICPPPSHANPLVRPRKGDATKEDATKREDMTQKEARGKHNKNGIYKCNKDDAMNDPERELCTKCVVNYRKRLGIVNVNVRDAKNAETMQ